MGPPDSYQSMSALEIRHERQLAAARESFPAFEIIETLGGYVAVPKGTPMISALNLDRLIMQLREATDSRT